LGLGASQRQALKRFARAIKDAENKGASLFIPKEQR
jgi:hypothetical protein